MVEDIIQKEFLTSNELCSFAGIKPYVLRFWESEFPEITSENSSGMKVYPESTLEIISKIKELLFTDKLSIEQVKFELIKNEALEEDSINLKTLEQLIIAKEMLQGVLLETQSIQNGYNWS